VRKKDDSINRELGRSMLGSSLLEKITHRGAIEVRRFKTCNWDVGDDLLEGGGGEKKCLKGEGFRLKESRTASQSDPDKTRQLKRNLERLLKRGIRKERGKLHERSGKHTKTNY